MDNQHLRQLWLRNFRSHQNLKLDFDLNFIFFSGPNGIGKTNILEAISLFSPGRGLRFANIEELRLISSTILNVIWLTPSMDRLWMGGSHDRRRFLDRMVMNFFPEHARDCSLYDQALRQRNTLFKNNQTDVVWFSAIEKQLAEVGHRIDFNRRKVIEILIETQRSLIKEGFFPYLEVHLSPDRISNPEEYFEELVNSREKDRVAGRTLIGPHRSDLIVRHSAKNIEARYCSTGEQKSLLLSLFVANALAICNQFGKSPIILLDEIEAHLDQDNLAILFGQLQKINAQVFVTGTEHNSFKALGIDSLYFNLILTSEGVRFL